jgi:mono/diheme cytochrome c family protein
MKTLSYIFATMMVGWLIISACSSRTNSLINTPVPNLEGAMPERLEIPEEYADLVNPLTDEKTAVSEGRILFESNCASCHGVNGGGDGPAAAGLEPPPQNLSQIQADLSDAYLFWRVSDGGLMEPFNSVMPAWRGILSEDHIWQIILFLRTL